MADLLPHQVETIHRKRNLALAWEHYLRGLVPLQVVFEVIEAYGWEGHAEEVWQAVLRRRHGGVRPRAEGR